MSEIVSATPVRSNLAQMLLQLKELPADMVSDSLNKFVALEKTPQFLKDIKEESTGSATATSSDNDEKPIIQKIPTTEDICNCRKSRCLKLYCQCFAAKTFCSSSCNCESCANTVAHSDLRMDAIKGILERNPNAFDSKFKAGNINALGTNGAHKTGCRCRKSMCLKKYCECFQLSVPCSPICTCLHCCNTADGAAFAGKGQAVAATKMSHIRKLGDGFQASGSAGDGEDVLKAASDLAQMKRESIGSSSDDGSYRSASPLSLEEGGAPVQKPRGQAKRARRQHPANRSKHLTNPPSPSPRLYLDGSMPTSGGSPGPSMLSVLPPPRSLAIRAPPLSLPNGKRKRDGSFGLDESSPKSNSSSSPTAHRVAKPSILNRPKSCPGSTNKFDGLDSSVFKGRSPVLGSPGYGVAVPPNPAFGGLTARSASPNTMHVATALSLLCGLGNGKVPETPTNTGSALKPDSNRRIGGCILPTGSPVLPPSALTAGALGGTASNFKPRSGSMGDRMDVTSEEDFCEISPIDMAHGKSRTINVPPPIHESGFSDGSDTTSAPSVVNFDQLAAGDGVTTGGESVLNAWASPAVQVDRISTWSQPAVELPRTPSGSVIYDVTKETRTATPIQTEN